MPKFLLLKDSTELCTLVKPFGPLFGTLRPYTNAPPPDVKQQDEMVYTVRVSPANKKAG